MWNEWFNFHGGAQPLKTQIVGEEISHWMSIILIMMRENAPAFQKESWRVGGFPAEHSYGKRAHSYGKRARSVAAWCQESSHRSGEELLIPPAGMHAKCIASASLLKQIWTDYLPQHGYHQVLELFATARLPPSFGICLFSLITWTYMYVIDVSFFVTSQQPNGDEQIIVKIARAYITAWVTVSVRWQFWP